MCIRDSCSPGVQSSAWLPWRLRRDGRCPDVCSCRQWGRKNTLLRGRRHEGRTPASPGSVSRRATRSEVPVLSHESASLSQTLENNSASKSGQEIEEFRSAVPPTECNTKRFINRLALDSLVLAGGHQILEHSLGHARIDVLLLFSFQTVSQQLEHSVYPFFQQQAFVLRSPDFKRGDEHFRVVRSFVKGRQVGLYGFSYDSLLPGGEIHAFFLKIVPHLAREFGRG